MKYLTPAACFLVLPLFTSCGDDDPTTDGGGGQDEAHLVDATLRRDRAVVHAKDTRWTDARAEIAPLVASPDALVEDLIRAAAIELADQDYQPATAFIDRALERDAKDAAALYMRGRMYMLAGEIGPAIEDLRSAREAAPDDLATRLLLGLCLEYHSEDVDDYVPVMEEARDLFLSIEDIGMENGGAWYVTAIYRLTQLEEFLPADDVQRYRMLRDSLLSLDLKAASDSMLNLGELALLRPSTPRGNHLDSAPVVPTFERSGAGPASLAGADRVRLHDMNGDRKNDIVTSGPRGLYVTSAGTDGKYTAVPVRKEPTGPFAAIDLNRDDDWDLIWASGRDLGLVEYDEGIWNTRHGVTIPRMPSDIHDLVAVDYDHDGDLDLLVVGDFGARLLRNDGAGILPNADPDAPRGSFVDATEGTLLPQGVALTWCATEDLDSDQDVDLLVGGATRTAILSSQRGGRFLDVTEDVLGDAVWARKPLLADLDGDARVDAFVPGAQGSTLWLQSAAGKLVSRPLDVNVPANATPEETDLDLDGLVDLVWRPETGVLGGVLAIGLAERLPFNVPGEGAGPCTVGDLDFDVTDVRNEIVRIGPEGPGFWRTNATSGKGTRLRYWGDKDNRQAIGAIVEVRARGTYRRIYWRGDQQIVGLGQHPYADVIRVTWPNGVNNNRLAVEPGDQILFSKDADIQDGTLIGSCPFLYAWNGTTFEFISDVLGITPLGLPMAPGMLVPPDHDEYVLIRGDQLVPKDGVLEMQVTEELREVTYLDRVRLDVIDHPAGTEVQPNERFTFPPFPEPHVHTLRDPLSPLKVTGSDGEDWTAALQSVDGEHASPFKPIGGQYQGMAPHHFLELAFDPERTKAAKKLRLVCTGWFFWSDASVNMATSRTPGLEFIPPMLEVPDGKGGWKVAGPPLGFPAGKTKTMVIDVTEMLDRSDPRMRLSSTLRLYWDSIRLAVDDDDAGYRTTSLEPTSGDLWLRGFSKPIISEREDEPEVFLWDEVVGEPRWDQHPGMYTKYGECEALLHDIDDRFVILGSGDCLTLRFDANELPPVPDGYVRDYLLFLDGWAKDRDPNTVEALRVEPLPFHGMSGYPYGPDESFPDTPAHQEWNATWNTRPARCWIAPLSPAAWDAWAQDQ